MTYQEMQQAEAKYLAAINDQSKKQRGATKAQLAYRAKRFGRCPDCLQRKDICRELGGCQVQS